MLGKLLKYDLKAMGRLLLPLYGAVILMGFISIFFFGNGNTDSALFNTFSFFRLITVLVYVLYTLLIAASLVLSLVLSVSHFRKNLLGSQGYLMNTLPVKPAANIASILISSCIFQIGAMVVSLFTVLFSVCAGTGTNILDIFKAISRLTSILSEDPIIILRMFEVALLGLVTLIGTNLMLYASMAVGHSFSAKKTFKSILTFIGFYIVSQIINSIIISCISQSEVFYTSLLETADMFIVGVIVLQAVYAAAYWFITSYFLKNKLNLQ